MWCMSQGGRGTSSGLEHVGPWGPSSRFCILCQVQWEIINKLKAGSGKVKELKVFAKVITLMTHDVRAG